MKHEDYVRKAKVVRVVDGDTLDIDIDLGFGIQRRERVRLARVDCDERFTEKGKEATAYLNNQFHFVKDVTIQSGKNPRDKYGRYIAEVWNDVGQNISDLLLKEKLAILYGELTVNVLG